MKASLILMIGLIDSATEKIGRLVAWLSLLLVVVVCSDVFLRYCFNLSYVLSRELEWHLFALCFF